MGVEFHFSSYQYLLSDLFVKYPIFLQANLFQVPVIVVPASRELCGVELQGPLRHILKDIHDMFIDIGPLPLKYPFAILGISDTDTPLAVEELTSQMDQFLIESVGLSLDAMGLLTEQPQFDFKERFPEGRGFAELAAALANLRGGGVVLIGVDNQGNITGLPRGHLLDDLLLRISNIIQDTCQPRPHFDLRVFDDPSHVGECVVVVRIREMEYKPCMIRGKVYVRVGSSTRAAGPDEVRRLVLG